MDEKFELACFQIITYVGTARTHFIKTLSTITPPLAAKLVKSCWKTRAFNATSIRFTSCW